MKEVPLKVAKVARRSPTTCVVLFGAKARLRALVVAYRTGMSWKYSEGCLLGGCGEESPRDSEDLTLVFFGVIRQLIAGGAQLVSGKG